MINQQLRNLDWSLLRDAYFHYWGLEICSGVITGFSAPGSRSNEVRPDFFFGGEGHGPESTNAMQSSISLLPM